MTVFEALKQVTSSIKTWAEDKFLNKNETTADDFGVYVQDTEPIGAIDGDIWIDTKHDPSYIRPDIPSTLPNPNALTFTGFSDNIYDGSIAVQVAIPSKTSDLENDSGYITHAAVQSVNGETGDVVITATSIGAQPAGNYVVEEDLGPFAKKDTVFLTDLDYDLFDMISKGANAVQSETDPTVPQWAKQESKPSYNKSEVGLGNVDNVRQYSDDNPPPYPVTSVNGKTGKITVGELPVVTTADNGKVLMVVNGAWKAVDLNMSVDENGVVSM